MEQLPYGDAAWHALVSRFQVPLPSYTAIPLLIQNILLGNPQWVDEIVFPQSNQENVVLEEACMLRYQFIQRLQHIVNKEGKERRTPGKELASGSRE